MEKFYTYKNGVVSITLPTDEQMARIRRETEEFMRKVIIYRSEQSNGHNDQTRGINKE